MYDIIDKNDNSVPDIFESNDFFDLDNTAISDYTNIENDYYLLEYSVATDDVAIKQNFENYISYKQYTFTLATFFCVSTFCFVCLLFKIGGRK